MKIPKEIEDKFYSGEPFNKTKFGINASVLICAGPNKGHGGAVISVTSIEPVVEYSVELSDGTTVRIKEDDLKEDT